MWIKVSNCSKFLSWTDEFKKLVRLDDFGISIRYFYDFVGKDNWEKIKFLGVNEQLEFTIRSHVFNRSRNICIKYVIKRDMDNTFSINMAVLN